METLRESSDGADDWRMGEVLAQAWRDIDFPSRVLVVGGSG
jgi:hypothetical protein